MKELQTPNFKLISNRFLQVVEAETGAINIFNLNSFAAFFETKEGHVRACFNRKYREPILCEGTINELINVLIQLK